MELNKHKTINQHWLNVGTASATLAQHLTSVGSASGSCWEGNVEEPRR